MRAFHVRVTDYLRLGNVEDMFPYVLAECLSVPSYGIKLFSIFCVLVLFRPVYEVENDLFQNYRSRRSGFCVVLDLGDSIVSNDLVYRHWTLFLENIICCGLIRGGYN